MYDSPYYLSPYYSRYDEPLKYKPPKPKLWTCHYCGCANLPESLMCSHCNAPRFLDEHKKKAVLWNVAPSSVRIEYIEVKHGLIESIRVMFESLFNTIRFWIERLF